MKTLDEMRHRHLLSADQQAEIGAWIANGRTPDAIMAMPTHLWRALHEFTAAGVDVVAAPVGALAERDPGIWRVVPNTSALLRACAAINELLGESAREFLAASHLRRQ